MRLLLLLALLLYCYGAEITDLRSEYARVIKLQARAPDNNEMLREFMKEPLSPVKKHEDHQPTEVSEKEPILPYCNLFWIINWSLGAALILYFYSDSKKSVSILLTSLIVSAESALDPSAGLPDVNNPFKTDPIINYKSVVTVPTQFEAASVGTFSVGQRGDAMYEIPIDTPPGRKVEPNNFAIVYNSFGQNGLLGIGMHLSMLSAISRTSATLKNDGYSAGVSFTSRDRFQLDGNPLQAVNGVYGANGTIYRTVKDNFARVTSYSSPGINGPAYFEVVQADGMVFEYGRGSASNFFPQANATLLWALSKITDRNGNFMSFNYTTLGTSFFPTRIDYTGSPTIAPFNSILFNLEDRPDKISRYINGVLIQDTQRLKSIQTYHRNQLISTTELTYLPENPNDLTSKLSQVTKKDAQGMALEPIQFQWTEDNNFWKPTLLTQKLASISSNSFIPVDITGDSRTDIVQLLPSTRSGTLMNVFHSDGESYSLGFQQEFPNLSPTEKWLPLDVQGTGTSDFVYIARNEKSGNTDLVLIKFDAESQIFDVPQVINTQTVFLDSAKWVALDVNADSRSDLVRLSSDSTQSKLLIQVFLSNGSQLDYLWQGVFDVPSQGQIFSMDINGDRNGDLVQIQTGLQSSGAMFNTFQANVDATGNFIEFTLRQQFFPQGSVAGIYFVDDMNGDSNYDLIHISPSSSSLGSDVEIYFSTGVQFATPTIQTFDLTANPGLLTGDANGDGKTDIINIQGSTSGLTTVTVYPCNGTAYTSGITTTLNEPFDLDNLYAIDLSGNGRADILRLSSASGSLFITVLKGSNSPNYLSQIQDGFGATISIEYLPATNETIYSSSITSVQYPLSAKRTPVYIVSSTTSSNGGAGPLKISYSYENGLSDLSGPGFLGFQFTNITNDATGLLTRKEFLQTWPAEGSLVQELAYSKNRTLVSSSLQQWLIQPTTSNTFFVAVNSSISSSYTLSKGELYSQERRVFQYDAWGLVTSENSFFYNNSAIYTNNSYYAPDATNWRFGWLKESNTTTVNTKGETFSIRKVADWYLNGLLRSTTDNPNTPNQITKLFVYDAFGNPAQETDQPVGLPPITVSYRYDSLGRFTVGSTNPLNQTSSQLYHDYFRGALLWIVDLNGQNTSFIHNSIGQKVFTTQPSGVQSSQQIQFCKYHLTSCPVLPNGRIPNHFITTNLTESPPLQVFYDELNREVRTVQISMFGEPVITDKEYNLQGETSRTSEPYFQNEIIPWNTVQYDELGRIITFTRADGNTTLVVYDGLVTTVINALGQTLTRITDTMGKIVRVIDNAGNQSLQEYDAGGRLTKITNPLGNTIVRTYDLLGNVLTETDADRGTSVMEYDSLGRLISKTDANGVKSSFFYDVLNRMIRREAPDGISTWTYDGINGIGKIATKTYPGYREEFKYDARSQLSQKNLTLEGAGSSFLSGYEYDTLGRLTFVVYPTGFTVSLHYNTYGFVTVMENDDTGKILWTALDSNAHGSITATEFGNGADSTFVYDILNRPIEIKLGGEADGSTLQHLQYSYDAIGQVISKSDVNKINAITKKPFLETFMYDRLNRLVNSRIAGSSKITEVRFDAVGNILYKGDVGHYTYQAGSNRLIETVAGTQTITYEYDAVGNLLRDSNSLQSITWTSFNKPSNIVGKVGTGTFTYGPDGQKVSQTIRTTSSVETTYYADHYELKRNELGGVEHRHFVMTPHGTVVDVISGSQEYVLYYHNDRLGSPSVITNEALFVVENTDYDSWGRLRDENWDYIAAPDDQVDDFGFTGKQQIWRLDLVDLNARLYSPLLGRFISSDSVLVDPFTTQKINRFSYANNNPQVFTDPSGHGLFSKIWKGVKKIASGAGKVLGKLVGEIPKILRRTWKPLVAAAVGIFATWALPMVLPFTGIASTIVAGAAGGFASSFTGVLLAGGKFSEALSAGLRSGLEGALTGGIAGSNLNQLSKNLLGGAIGAGESALAGTSPLFGFVMGAVAGGGAASRMEAGIPASNYLVDQLKSMAQQTFFRAVVGSVAKGIGLDVDELNLMLTAASIVGGRRNIGAGNIIKGVTNHKFGAFQAPFDVVDILLVYQGLPTATSMFVMNTGLDIKGGHSLGTGDVIVLSQWGHIAYPSSLNLYALPAGLIGPTGSQVWAYYKDLVTGFGLSAGLNRGGHYLKSYMSGKPPSGGGYFQDSHTDPYNMPEGPPVVAAGWGFN